MVPYLTTAAFSKKTLGYLEHQHRAVKFLDAVRTFVNNLPQGHQFFEPNANDHFDIFRNIVISQLCYEHTLCQTSILQVFVHIRNTPMVSTNPQHLLDLILFLSVITDKNMSFGGPMVGT